jgi:hypothetical protein
MQNNTFNWKIKKINIKETKNGKKYIVIDVENRYSDWDIVSKSKVDKVWFVSFTLFWYHVTEFMHDVGDFITLNFELRNEEYNWKNYTKVVVTDVHSKEKENDIDSAKKLFKKETSIEDIPF